MEPATSSALMMMMESREEETLVTKSSGPSSTTSTTAEQQREQNTAYNAEKASTTTPTNNAMALWSDVLASSDSGDVFSPAKPMADKECLHGVGLRKALHRAKLESRCGRRCSLMLLEGASCYEHFGVALKKACQAHPLEGDAFKSVVSLSNQTRQLSIRLREEIATPFQGFHANTYAGTIPSIHEKYGQSRESAYAARQRALLAREKYLKAVQDLEHACSQVQKTVVAGKITKNEKVVDDTKGVENSNNSVDDNNKAEGEAEKGPTDTSKTKWEQDLEEYRRLEGQEAVDRVTHLLSDVKVLQRRYESLVEKENEAVKFAQNIEAISLEGLQKLEEQRLCIFYDSLVRTFQEIKTCLDNLVISAEGDVGESSKEKAKVVQQKKPDFFATILKVGNYQNETTGVADAETLGLSEEIGKLRDACQTRIAERIARIKKVKSLAAFFEEIATAATKLGNGLQQVVKHEDSYVSSDGTPVEHLRTLINSCEGPRTISLWSELTKTMEHEAEASHQFARSLRNIKASKLDHFLQTDEKTLRDEADQDDTLWKHLCDAARTELRAEAKYRQTTAQTAKARERIRSVDKESFSGEKPTKSPQKVNRAMNGMNKAFGNFLSILPDGGEQAMQILTPDARRAVAERSLQEADEKQSKGKHALDSATSYKTRAMASYKLKTEPAVKKYELEEMSGMEDIKAAMVSLVACVDSLRRSRCESLGPSHGEKPLTFALLDLDEWAQTAAKEVADTTLKTKRESDNGLCVSSGFKLDFVLTNSENLLNVARIRNASSFESEYSDAASDKDDASASSFPAEQVAGQDSTRSLDLATMKNEEEEPVPPEQGESTGGQQTSRWLQKSFSTPIVKPGFKTLRKFHSMGEAGKESEADALDDSTETSTVSTTVPPQNMREGFETEIFSAFCPDYEGTLPGVTNSFACAFLPKECKIRNVALVEHGRLFLTHKGAVFVAWRGKKAVIHFSAMVSAEINDSLFGLADDTLLVTAQNGGSLLLGCFNHRDKALEILHNGIAAARKTRVEGSANNKDVSSDDKGDTISTSVIPVSPDATVQKMEVVLSKKLRGISIDKFHEIVWSDKTPESSFYGGWLNKGNCFDISIGDWESSDEGFAGSWCGENYTHKRRVIFKLRRNSMIGPPIAGVTQTQFCRQDSADRSIMQMTVAFDGIPYSDSFTVEVRWVATRSGAKDIGVQVGVFVEFQKSTILKSQIRNGTLTETKPVHESLFEYVKTALNNECAVDESGEADDGVDGDDVPTTDLTDSRKIEGMLGALTSNLPNVVKEHLNVAVPVIVVLLFLIFRLIFWSSPLGGADEIAALNVQIKELKTEVSLMRETMEELADLIKKQATIRRR